MLLVTLVNFCFKTNFIVPSLLKRKKELKKKKLGLGWTKRTFRHRVVHY